jgi:hypothetical protein
MEENNSKPCWVTSAGNNEAIQHLKQSVAGGRPWYIALLEAIALWSWPEESHNGQHYCYLIEGEAFDWLLLAERLSEEVADSVPQQELEALLFFGKLPEELSEDDFKRLIGIAKYQAYLNYFYGVIIERFVLLAVEEEICKENHSHIFSAKEKDKLVDGYQRVYGANQRDLLRLFRQHKGYPDSDTISLSQLQEFTYWLFKYRLANCDKARVASDTKKGLEYYKRQQASKEDF